MPLGEKQRLLNWKASLAGNQTGLERSLGISYVRFRPANRRDKFEAEMQAETRLPGL